MDKCLHHFGLTANRTALLAPFAPDLNIECRCVAWDRSTSIRTISARAFALNTKVGGEGVRIARCRGAQVVQTCFLQPFDQYEHTHNMMFDSMVLHGACVFARVRVFPCRGPVAQREALNFGRTFVAAKWDSNDA